MDNLRTLWAFTAVARAGNFTRAAEELGISTVALSRSVARLEESLNTRLFVRTTRQVHLTDAGRDLFERVNAPFATIGDALNGVRHASGQLTGTVRVSSVTAFGRRRVLPALRDFLALHPKIAVTLALHDGASGRSRQAYDIRITWGEPPEQDKVAHFLTSLPLAVVASPDYLRRHGEPRTPADLANHACITAAFDNGVRGRWFFTPKTAEAGTPPVIHHPVGPIAIMGELEAIADAAVAGLGIGVASAEDAAERLAAGALREILVDYTVVARDQGYSQITLQHPQRKLMGPPAQALVDFLLDRLRAQPREDGPSKQDCPDRATHGPAWTNLRTL